MEDGSDSEYEVEEAVVLVELNGIIDSNFLFQEDIPCKILGIDSENPILQLGQYTFAGEYEDTLGTVVAYEPDESQNEEEKKYKFTAKTDKKLVMKRVFVQEKIEESLQKSVLSSSKISPKKEYPLQEITENSIDKSKKVKLSMGNRNTPKKIIKEEADSNKVISAVTLPNITTIEEKLEASSHEESVEPYSNKNQSSTDRQAAKRKEREHDDGDSNNIANKKRYQGGNEEFMPHENVDQANSPQMSSDAIISQDMEDDVSKSPPEELIDIESCSTDNDDVMLKLSSHQKPENSEKIFTSESSDKSNEHQEQSSLLSSPQILEESIANENAEDRNREEDSVININLQIHSTDDDHFISSSNNPELRLNDSVMNDLSSSSMKQLENVEDPQSSDVIEIQIVVEDCPLSDEQNVSVSEENKTNNTLLISDEQEGQAIITLSFGGNEAEMTAELHEASNQENKSVSSSVINDTLNEVLDVVSDPSVDADDFDSQHQPADHAANVTEPDLKLPNEMNLEGQFLKDSSSFSNRSTISMHLSFDSDNDSTSMTKMSELPENICESPDCSSTSASDALKVDGENNLNVQSSDKNLENNQRYISSESYEDSSLSEQMPTLTAGDSEKESPSFQRIENLQNELMPTISLEATTAETVVVESCNEESQNAQMSSSSLETLDEKKNITQSHFRRFPNRTPLEELKEKISTTKSPKSLPSDVSSSDDDSKDASCEVSQSSRNNRGTLLAVISESNECDEQVLNLVSKSKNELHSDTSENVGRGEIYADNSEVTSENVVRGEIYADNSEVEHLNKSHSRKLSSCEVSQSCNSKVESPNEENVNECDVFLQNSPKDIENFADASSSRRDALVSADEGLKEDDIVRHSITSEGSTSEISQSHKVESYSNDEASEQAEEFYNIELCSQSTSSMPSHPTESKDFCVSSCDAGKNTGPEFPDSEIKNTSCEVSQSDRLESHSNLNMPDDPSDFNDNSVSGGHERSSNQENYCEVTESYEAEECIHSENTAVLAENSSSECEPLMVSHDRPESMNTLSDSREPCASSDHSNPISVCNITAENSTSCEVTQSSVTENISIENVDPAINNKLHSNECEVFEESDYNSEDSTLASDSQSLVSSVILLNQEEEEESINPSCEVSQSFKSIEDNNLPFEECCVSSDEGNEFSTHYANIEENKITDEVSQSVTLSIPLTSDAPDYELSECDQPGLVSHSVELFSNDQNESAESSKEVCSSDEINAASGNLDENMNNSACEVTQSNRTEEGILMPQSQDLFENESSNECEAYGRTSSSLEDQNVDPSDRDCEAKNICESSDDIELASSENLISTQKQFEDNSALSCICQSSRYGSKSSDLPDMDDNNEYDNRIQIEAENNDTQQSNICESSESRQTNRSTDPCTSSDKIDNEDTYDLASNDKLCDSISNADASICIGDATGSISQSERDLNNTLITSSVASSVPPYNTVTVSSSVDISSNPVGIVYSSQITHFNPGQEIIYISNSEVSQSSTQLNQKSTGNNEDSNEVENSSCTDSSLAYPSVIVSSDTKITSNTLENTESNNELVSDSNVIETSELDRSTCEFIGSSCTRVESSSPDIIPETEQKAKNSSSSDKDGKGAIVVKKFGRRMKFIPKVACKAKEEKVEQSTSGARDTGFRDTNLDQQPTAGYTSESSVNASGNTIGGNTDSRPSLLEVIVSSASDFRNSLIHDNNNFDRVTSPSEIAESSSNLNNDPHDESANLLVAEMGSIREGPSYSQLYASGDSPYLNKPDTDSLVTESVTYDEEKDNNSQHRVSQSSEITNVYSSVIVSGTPENESVSESSQHQLVQSTSGVIKRSTQSNEDANTNELVASTPSTCEVSEVSDSSHAKFASPSVSDDNVVNLDNSRTHIESSDDVDVCTENLSVDETENADANVTSTPFETKGQKLQSYSADGSDQCSMIEGTDDVSFSSELVQSRLNIYAADGSGQCALIECTDGAQALYDSDSNIPSYSADRSDQCTLIECTDGSLRNIDGNSELPENVEDLSNPNLNITSDSKVSGSHDHQRSKVWRSRFQEENCASSSMDENSTTDDASRTQILIIESEASNEAEVLKSRFVDNNDSENFFLVSESGQIVINPPESVDSPSDYNVDRNYKQDVSQSSSADQTLQPELYSENNEATLFPLQSESYREVTLANETYSSRITEEIESSGNSVVPSELSQNILLASNDSSIYSQSVDFNDGSIHSSSFEVLQYPTDEQIVASSLSSTMCDRIETLTDSVPLQSLDVVDERSNVSQSYIDENEPQQISEVLESNEESDNDRHATHSPDSHSSEYILQEEDDCDNSC
ncbi:uro-adherence factor A isoform X1 [Parasteatoda tepidariorum]|uniref:uro-adherence factor A isoform X1 n=1 Tax=Parasteatoda tepidariorum TaxID=114398 RepID=UPI001C71AC59|nr:uncharacterized protein LOC107449912 isoform X1 [Parasteatoda tepidariorum]